MKKFLPALCALLLALSVLCLAACSKTGAAAEESATLTVWCWDATFNVYAMEEAAKIYRKSVPNFALDIVEISWDDIQQKLVSMFGAGGTGGAASESGGGALPDIILIQDNAAEKNITNFPQAFVPLDGEIDMSQFTSYKVDFGTVGGKSYTVPFDNGATATFLRRDIIEQAGLAVSDFNDITWDDFIELGRVVKARTGKALCSMPQDSADFIAIMMQSAGTWYFDESGETNIAGNAALRECMRLYKRMIDEGVCLQAKDWNDYIASIQGGAVAGTINGCWIIASITAAAEQAGKWAVANTPRIAALEESINYSSNGGSSWLIMAGSEKRGLALDFMAKTFAGSTELYDTILPSSGAIATWIPAAQSPVYSQAIDFFGGQRIYSDIIGYAAKIKRVKYGVYNYEARDAVTIALYEILKGADVDAALATAQKTVQFQIGEGGN